MAQKKTEVNRNYLILRLFGFEFEPDEMTKILGLTPRIVGKKGEEHYIGPSEDLRVYGNTTIGNTNLKKSQQNILENS